MPTHWTVILGLTCDRCGAYLAFEGKSKPGALKQARAAGWYIDAHTVCPGCWKKENSNGVL